MKVANTLLLFVCICLLIGLACFPLIHPAYNWDTLGYLGNVYLLDGFSAESVHQHTYEDASTVKDPDGHFRLIADPNGAAIRFRDSRSFLEYLPFYSTRLAYIGTAYALLKLGVPPLRTFQVISVACYIAVQLIVLLWLKRHLGWTRASIFAVLVSLPFVHIAQESTPDLMSLGVLLLASYLIVEEEKLSFGLALLMASLLVRTDNITLLFAVLCMCVIRKSVPLPKTAGLLAAAVVLVFVLHRASGSYGWALLFQQSFYGPFPYPAEIVPHVTPSMYFHVVVGSLRSFVGDYAPLLLLLAMSLAADTKLRTLNWAVLGGSALHFFLFPNADLRYYVALVTLSLVASSLAAIKSRRSERIGTSMAASALPASSI